MAQFWLSGLNPEQQQAVQHTVGPLLILAGAGSGKTTVLVHRTGRLLEERCVPAQNLFVLTFTNKAARELKARVSVKLGPLGKRIWAGTFHALGLTLLRRFHKEAGLPERFAILDQTDATALIKEILVELKYPGKDTFAPDRLLARISRWRENNQQTAQQNDPDDICTEWLLPKYLARLKALGAADFDSLIFGPTKLLRENSEIRARIQSEVQFLMVDEFQDTSKAQMDFIELLIGGTGNLAVVGDDDQAIYGWRGAFVENILNFHHRQSDTTVVRLERNYRSQAAILNMANAVIAKNQTRHGKVLRPENTKISSQLPELFVFGDEDEELNWILTEIETHKLNGHKLNEIAVLYRSNTQSVILEASLRARKINYQISGSSSFFDRKETRDLLAYIRCALFPQEISLRRILNTPSRGLGDTAYQKIDDHARLFSTTFVSAARHLDGTQLTPQGQKGLADLWIHLEELKQILLDSLQPRADFLNWLDQRIGFKKFLFSLSKEPEQGSKRWNFVEIFADILEKNLLQPKPRTVSLQDFLDHVELRDLDAAEKTTDGVQLMTLHASKGLEFPIVMLLGLEEDILPHKRLGSDISEERRLFYVGITRAQRQLLITRCQTRKVHGRQKPMAPSRFLLEIDSNLYFTHANGCRPISESARQDSLQALLAKLRANPGPVI